MEEPYAVLLCDARQSAQALIRTWPGPRLRVTCSPHAAFSEAAGAVALFLALPPEANRVAARLAARAFPGMPMALVDRRPADPEPGTACGPDGDWSGFAGRFRASGLTEEEQAALLEPDEEDAAPAVCSTAVRELGAAAVDGGGEPGLAATARDVAARLTPYAAARRCTVEVLVTRDGDAPAVDTVLAVLVHTAVRKAPEGASVQIVVDAPTIEVTRLPPDDGPLSRLAARAGWLLAGGRLTPLG